MIEATTILCEISVPSPVKEAERPVKSFQSATCVDDTQLTLTMTVASVQSYSPGGAVVYPQLIHASMDPPESTTQTASRAV